MKTFQTKTVMLDGQSVSIDVEEIFNTSGVPAVRATAKCGSVTVTLNHSLVPVDGAQAVLDPAHVQNAIDDLRQRAARMAVTQAVAAQQLSSSS